jgi:DivIVA domain-containing protein
MEDERVVISSGVSLTPEAVANRTFATGFRGFDQSEVRSFLKRVSEELTAAAAREQALREALQDALVRAAHPELDADTLTAALGEHAARLLTNARDAATNIVSEAETRAARIIGEAETKIARVRAEADSLLARRAEEAERLTAGLRQAAEADARALRERARAEAEAEIESARVQGREMVSEARGLRERMLADLTRRRRTAEVHIEQLSLARQRLLEAYGVVRRTLDEATAELSAAEAEARPALAAATSGHAPADGGERPSPPPQVTRRPPPPPTVPRAAPARSLAAVPTAPETAGPVVRELAAAGGAAARTAPGGALAAVQASPTRTSPAEPPGASPPGDAPPTEDDVATGPASASPEAAEADESPPGTEGVPPSEPPVSGPVIEDPVETETAADDGGPPRVVQVEELFARIRAAQPAAEADEHAQLAEPPDAPPVEPPPAPAAADAPARESVGAPGAVADESALFRRDELLDPLDADLTRQLKRVLQDEQNEVLDRLRRQRRPQPGTVLPDAKIQLDRYQAVAHPVLAEAARRGFESVSGAVGAQEPSPAVVERWAAELAADLVNPLRERLERALQESDPGATDAEGDDAEPVPTQPLAERLSAGYRQWKIDHVEPAVRHHVVAAFSRGAYAATPDRAGLRWVVDDDGPCPDCDDNALAGALPKGQAFPTGQPHPPAHVGCRCVLVPADPS